MVVTLLIPALWQLRQEDGLKFKASLGYIVNSRFAWATAWDHVSRTKQNKANEQKPTKICQKFWEELPPVPWGLPEPFMASQHTGQHPGPIYPSLQLALPLSPHKWMGKTHHPLQLCPQWLHHVDWVFTSDAYTLSYMFCLVWGRVLLYSPGWPRTHQLPQAGLKHVTVLWSLPPTCRNCRDELPRLLLDYYFVISVPFFSPNPPKWASPSFFHLWSLSHFAVEA